MQKLATEKLYLDIYATLMQIMLFPSGFLLSYVSRSGHKQ